MTAPYRDKTQRVVIFGLRYVSESGERWHFGWRANHQGLPNGAVVFGMFTSAGDEVCFLPAGLEVESEDEFWDIVRQAKSLLSGG